MKWRIKLEILILYWSPEETDDKLNTMVDLLRTSSGSFTFEINKSNILLEKLTINPDILLIGGSEMDVAELFKNSSLELAKLKTELKEQQDSLARSKKQLQRSESQYKAALEDSEKLRQEMREIAKQLSEKNEANRI